MSTLAIHESMLFRSLSDSDLRQMAELKFHHGRFAVAQVHDAAHHPHLVLCGPGTRHPDWMRLDVRTLIAIGDWRPGNPSFDKTLSLLRYEDAVHAGRGERHHVSVLHLGSYRDAADKARAELERRDAERSPWEATAA